MTIPRIKILLVDDDPEILSVLRDLMAIFGHDFVSATTGDDAIEKLKQDFFPGTDAFRHISMGMTSDYGIAIEEGSTMIRVGTAIFGER